MGQFSAGALRERMDDCIPATQFAGSGAMRKLPEISVRPRIGELLDHATELKKLYGKWPSFIYLFIATLWTPSLAAAAYLTVHFIR